MFVKENIQVGPDIYKMDITSQKKKLNAIPGQFVHIKVGKDGFDPLLRRPFSVFDINITQNVLSILYKVCGKGTKLLSEYKKEEKIDVLLPLGNGFDFKKANNEITLIGGGMGIAPLFYLAKKMYKNNNVKIFMGAAQKYDISYLKSVFSRLNIDVFWTTMDECLGKRETVVDLWDNCQLKEINNINPDFIYTCGPTAMLKAIKKRVVKRNIPAEASFEERMGCGVGVCLSCSIKTVNGNRRACKEGPVFPLKDVIFDE